MFVELESYRKVILVSETVNPNLDERKKNLD